jgi:hypothetical protein
MLVWQKNFEDANCPSPELALIFCAPEKPREKYLAFEPRTGTG